MTVRGNEGGRSWADLAKLDPLAAVIDPADERGGKNLLIDRIHKRALASAAGEVRGLAALDFGCGTGRLSAWLVRNGARVVGADVTPEMVEAARRNVPAASFVTIDGSSLPFDDGSFDLVVTAYVLQYYLDGDETIWRELARVLRGDGRVLAIEQVTDGEIGRGGPRRAYEQKLARAGFAAVEAVTIRSSSSRIVGIAARWPRVARLPLVPQLVGAEAARSTEKPLSEGRYADVLFSASRGS
jgi:ubiquinone/menaquinone biosynthesis C-methylase UbiE